MSTDVAPERGPRRPDPFAGVVALGSLVVFALHGTEGMLSRDLGIYAYAGQQVADGVPPYVGVLNRAGPLAHVLPGVGVVMLAVALVLMRRERHLRDRAEAALRDANAGLEQQVAQRTQALSTALARIRSFAVEAERSIEAERRRLAREVHDQVGQVGTAIKMLTLSLRAKLAPRNEPLVDELQAMADEAIRAVVEELVHQAPV